MGYPTAVGQPSYSGTFIPEIWAPRLLQKFYDQTCMSEIFNTDYEGDIRKGGDKVIIRQRPTITIRDYKKGQNLTFETPESTNVELDIDQGKYWAFTLDKVDAKQMDINAIDEWTADAAEQLKIAIETALFGWAYSYVSAYNTGATAGKKSSSINLGVSGTPLAVTKDNVLDIIVDAGTALDEQSVPQDGRWLVLPPAYCGLIKKSDLKDASITGDGKSILRNGRLGMIDRFTIYNSNLLTTATDGVYTVTNVLFGQKAAVSFATQLTESDQQPNPFGFGTLVKGLQVYGRKVVKPEALGLLYVRKG